MWDKYYAHDPKAYAPLLYDTFAKDSLLFVGMNPSFSASGFRSIFRNTKYESIDPTKFFLWSNISKSPDLVEQCIAMDKHAYTNYSLYFGRPIEIAEAVGLPWDHIDFFLYRETSQSNFMKRIHEGPNLNQFAHDQLAIFYDVLKAVRPRCIVVSNAFGSELIRKEYADFLKWDEKRGFHRIQLNGEKVPIFFSSMLSGQRSLDRWSYERLVWHVRQAVK